MNQTQSPLRTVEHSHKDLSVSTQTLFETSERLALGRARR
jgi:hypothetical protein